MIVWLMIIIIVQILWIHVESIVSSDVSSSGHGLI